MAVLPAWKGDAEKYQVCEVKADESGIHSSVLWNITF